MSNVSAALKIALPAALGVGLAVLLFPRSDLEVPDARAPVGDPVVGQKPTKPAPPIASGTAGSGEEGTVEDGGTAAENLPDGATLGTNPARAAAEADLNQSVITFVNSASPAWTQVRRLVAGQGDDGLANRIQDMIERLRLSRRDPAVDVESLRADTLVLVTEVRTRGADAEVEESLRRVEELLQGLEGTPP